MIQYAHAPSCGNAAVLVLHPGAAPWRLVRAFDAPPLTVADGEVVLSGEQAGPLGEWADYSGLSNGREVFYQLFAGTAWTLDGGPKSVIPAYLSEPLFASPDFAGFIRDRLEAGLAAEVAAGALSHTSDFVPVLTAYPQIDSVRLPVVTVTLTDRRAEVRGIGEHLIPDLLADDLWSVYQGWLDRSALQIAVWALSHADRVRLRDAVQRVIMLNLPLLGHAGYDMPDLSESDTQDFESYGMPVWQTLFTLSALHPAVVRTHYEPIRTTEVIANGDNSG